uniref:RING-type domain-containing protein n=1 Tax=Syphacia muris TaxID=451379 RepID=A0A158R6A5_9BILA
MEQTLDSVLDENASRKSFSQTLASFLSDGDDMICCEVCFEPFHLTERPPKQLPCGHNFCEQCLFSLCCHQQYYFLDSINCPTCRKEFNSSTAFNAPTNQELCKKLETMQQSANVTVIHVPDANNTLLSAKSAVVSTLTRLRGTLRRSVRQCAWCSKKISGKNCRKLARYCLKCSAKDDCLRISCLECCVNKHNGHQLATFDELEYNHQKLINDLKEIQRETQDACKKIDLHLKELKNDSLMKVNCVTLGTAKQKLLSEFEKELDFSLTVLENPETTPLPPSVLMKIRRRQMHNSAKIFKMLSFIEKCRDSINERGRRHLRLKTASVEAARSKLSSRQSRATLYNGNDSFVDSIGAVMAIVNNDEHSSVIDEAVKAISRKTATNDEKQNALIKCARQLQLLLVENMPVHSLLLFGDAFLNIFYQLSRLVSKYPAKKDSFTRKEVWKTIQMAYTDLLKCASKHWPSQHPDRVDLVDDLAFLCSLYSDVCDHATITICMIEAARARAASDKLSDDEKENQEIRLKLIDEHLLECRRIQKLQELCTTKSKGRFSLLKIWWKRLSKCFKKKFSRAGRIAPGC